MVTTKYSGFEEINDIQRCIMRFIGEWVKFHKTPISHKQVLSFMKKLDVPEYTVSTALKILVRKGYIRRAWTNTNRTFYVQLRTC